MVFVFVSCESIQALCVDMKITITKKLQPFLCLLCLVSFTSFSQAATFTNGNFDSGLAPWTSDGNVSLNAGKVELSTIGAGGLFSAASLMQGDFFSGDPAIQLGGSDNFLNFDVWYQDLGPGGGSGSVTSDGLVVSVYDELGISADLFFDSQFDFLSGAPSASVSLEISSLAGRTVGLFFDVFDENDGRNSLFTVDNVFFSATRQFVTVPEPETLFLLLPGLFIVCWRSRNRCF